VVLCEVLPDAAAMQALASKVGYSETAFAALADGEWRVRYFAPEVEVDFCGHATIALGAALALRNGDGIFPLRLNHARITVEGSRAGGTLPASLQSPPTRSSAAPRGTGRRGPGVVRIAGPGAGPENSADDRSCRSGSPRSCSS
jgi:predicted PhzF superfamily epimerase YddE/YHI9